MKVSIDIPAARIADIMVTAIECNLMTTSWCAGVYLISSQAGVTEDDARCWYSLPEVYEKPFEIEIKEIIDESKKPQGKNLKSRKVKSVEMSTAFALMAQKYGRHFGDFMNENEDNITADVFLQCLALGEVVYG